jgi:transmembrane sensor
MTQSSNAPDDGDRSRALDPAMEAAVDWFARLQADDVTTAERADFEAWKAADPAHRAAYRKLEALWGRPEFASAAERARPNPPASRLTPGSATARPRARLRAAALAAVLLLALGLGLWSEPRLALQADHRTGTGERRQIELADGSSLTLNSESAVSLDMSADRRRVRLLAGEVYFEVATDRARPFEVVGAEASARVLGTAFAVKDADGRTVVTVRHGRVRVDAGNSRGAPLTAGQQIGVANGQVSARTQVDPSKALAWLDGRLVFRRQPLGAVVDEIARHHSGWIVVANDRLRGIEVSGNYSLSDPVAIVESLAAATSAELIRVSDALLILR